MTELLSGNKEDEESTGKRLQLAFPWLKTHESNGLPENLEPPEGTLLGVLAQKSLTLGAYRSVAGTILESTYDIFPSDVMAFRSIGDQEIVFADRVCSFDFVPDGIALQSDVTSVHQETFRYAVVRRIMILIRRAAHQIGLNHVFDSNSNQIWQTIEGNLKNLLMSIYQRNGLRGRSSDEAFSVVCNRTTMTQNDIDNGRLVAHVSLQPAVPVERISVDLLLDNDGSAILRSA